MKRIIYHGSEAIIENPEYLKGNVHSDYGLGFFIVIPNSIKEIKTVCLMVASVKKAFANEYKHDIIRIDEFRQN